MRRASDGVARGRRGARRDFSRPEGISRARTERRRRVSIGRASAIGAAAARAAVIVRVASVALARACVQRVRAREAVAPGRRPKP